MSDAPPSPTPSVTTSMAPLGVFGPIFREREVAVGVDAEGSAVFARPRNILVDTGGDTKLLRSLVRTAGSPTRSRSKTSGSEAVAMDEPTEVAGIVSIPVDVAPPPDDEPDAGWSIEPASTAVARLGTVASPAMLNSVFFGAPGSIVGNPLGVGASFAGEFPFVGDIVTLEDRKVLLSTAEPCPAVRLTKALNLANRKKPCVLILDTGLCTVANRGQRRAEHPALRECKVHSSWRAMQGIDVADDEDEADVDDNKVLDFEAGHGTFISGIVRQVCPDAVIYNTGVLSSFGDGSIWGVLKAVARILAVMAADQARPDVVVMSFGGYFPLDESGFLGPAFRRLLGDAVIVAAAGNDATCRPHFPAALPDVVGVGGLWSGGRAWFSNFGGWVDACAPAVDVVSTFFTKFTEQIEGRPAREYRGWARWSGTSFAAPKVAAAIAQEQYLSGVSAQEAWRRLSSHEHYRHPDLGVVFNV